MSNTNSNPTKKYDLIKLASFIVNVVTLLVLSIYTFFTRQQVTETQTANAISQTALVEVNRPYIVWKGFNPVRFTDPVTHDSRWHLGTTFENVGNTPASNAVYYVCDPIIKAGIDRPNLICLQSDNPSSGDVIGPRQQSVFDRPSVSDSDLDATRTATKSIFVLGYIIYDDGESFNNEKQPHRFTKFCAQVIVPTTVDPKVIYSGPALPLVWQGCNSQDWSCTDGGCKTRPKEAQPDKTP